MIERSLRFSTPIYSASIEIDNDLLLRRIYHERENDPKGLTRSNLEGSGAWHSQMGIWNWVEVEQLNAEIRRVVETIASEYGYPEELELRLVSMWANVSSQGGCNRSHTHPCTLWTGVYYVQADDTHPPIRFTDPRPQALHGFGYVRDHDAIASEFAPFFRMEARTGRLLLFPAWLVHEVEPNASTEDRVSISFNIVQDFLGGTHESR